MEDTTVNPTTPEMIAHALRTLTGGRGEVLARATMRGANPEPFIIYTRGRYQGGMRAYGVRNPATGGTRVPARFMTEDSLHSWLANLEIIEVVSMIEVAKRKAAAKAAAEAAKALECE